MIPVLTAAQMREADRRTIEEAGVPGLTLMEKAGSAVAEAVRRRYAHVRRLAVLCGKGNNGGDGFVAARRLRELSPAVVLLARRDDVQGDARAHLQEYERAGGALVEAADAPAWERERAAVLGSDCLVDALLGTGLREAPSGLAAQAIADIAAEQEAGRLPAVAVDIPSGLSSDRGEVGWESLRAVVTVAFGAPKYGHVLPPASDRVGELVVADIGIPPRFLDPGPEGLWLLEAADAASAWPRRAPGAHKGSFGHVLVVAGSVGKSGAAVLAGVAALRAGAGLVTVASPAPVQPLVAQGRAELMTEPLPAGADGCLAPAALERAAELARSREACVVGPGVGQTPGARAFVRAFVQACEAAMVVDADGLNALAPSGTEAAHPLRRARPTVLTPHPGEMARWVGGSAAEVQRRRQECARELAARTGAVVVLKGQRTLVAEPGGRLAVNPTGNPGMATGGTGDVLAGIIGALLARGHDAWTAATAGVYAHGLAGDRAAGRLGQEALLAGDVAEALPVALLELEGAR